MLVFVSWLIEHTLYALVVYVSALWLINASFVGFLASSNGRNFWIYAIFGLLTGPIAGIAALRDKERSKKKKRK